MLTPMGISALLVALLAGPVLADETPTVVSCSTTKGPIKIEVFPSWAPNGAARFIELVEDSFYTNIAFFRCVKGFLTQFGLSTDPRKKHWHYKTIPDDPHNGRPIGQYVVSYAGSGPNSRSTQLFFAFEDLDFLGKAPWEVPFGRVSEGAEVLDRLYKGYGDIPPYGQGPDQQKIQTDSGDQYLRDSFPELDYLLFCSVDEADPDPGHLLRGSEELDRGREVEVQERAGEEAQEELPGQRTFERVDGAEDQHAELPEEADNREVDGAAEVGPDTHQDFADLKPPPVVKHPDEAPVNNEPAPVEVEEDARLRVPSKSLDDDMDDTAMFESRLSDRETKIRIIFVLLCTVIGLLVYNVWRNKRKHRVGKLT